MTDTVAPEPTPEQAALFARVRRMMLIAGLTSALAVAVVLIAVGYRLYRGEGSPAASSTEITATLPKGARIVSTAVAGDGSCIGGTTEIRTFDAYAEARRPPQICRRAPSGIVRARAARR
jgi:hypothetical protein